MREKKLGSRSLAGAGWLVLLHCGIAAAPLAAATDSYVLARGNHWTSAATIPEIQRLHRRYSGEFLWFRRGGKAFLIREPATLAEAFALFRPMEIDRPERRDLERRQREIDRKENALDREEEELDRLADRNDEEEEPKTQAESERRDLEHRQRELEARRRDVGQEARKLEPIERALEEREEALERKVERQLWELIDRAVRRGAARPEDRR